MYELVFKTKHNEFYDISEDVQKIVDKSEVKNGICSIFVYGSTASVSTIEFEPNLLKDLREALEKIAPLGRDYHHHKTWGDDNGSAHVRATIMKPGIVVPVEDGKLVLGTWQQIMLMEFDTKERERKVIVSVVGG